MTSTLGPNGYTTDPDQRPFDQTVICTTAQLATLPYQGAYTQVWAQDTPGGSMALAAWGGSGYTPVSWDGTVTVNARDGQGRVTSYTDATGTYTVTYGSYGPATVSGNGKITTYNYSAAGVLTSVTTV